MDRQLKPKAIIGNQLKAAVVSFLGGAVISLLLAFPIKLLWNWIMPGMFDLPIISALEAWGISFLARLIFPTVISLPSKDKSNTNQKS